MTDLAAAYRGVRIRVRDLVSDPGAAGVMAPATPDWTVHDLVAHLGGITADIVSGNLAGVGTDAWADAQVVARRDRPMGKLLGEWDECAARVEPMIGDFGEAGGQLLGDALTHEYDIRGALGEPGKRTCEALDIGFEWLARRVGGAWDADGAGVLRIEHDAGVTVCGATEASGTTTLRVSRFEFARAATGRRSLEQIAAYDWVGDARASLLVASPFATRPTALVE